MIFVNRRDHHQILRKEIVFALLPTTLTGFEHQGLKFISDLMVLLENGGFFRDNGLNSLPSVKHLCSLLNDPNIFKNVDVKNETVVSFIRKRKL